MLNHAFHPSVSVNSCLNCELVFAMKMKIYYCIDIYGLDTGRKCSDLDNKACDKKELLEKRLSGDFLQQYANYD